MTEGERFNFGRWQGEEIEWVCLEDADDGECVLALSTHGLEFGRPFDSRGWGPPQSRRYITWEESEIRSWLNGEFYQNAFTSAEKKRIVTNFSANSVGNDTWDNVFLLSAEEVDRYLSPTQFECYETDYARKVRVKRQQSSRMDGIKAGVKARDWKGALGSMRSAVRVTFSDREKHLWLTRTVSDEAYDREDLSSWDQDHSNCYGVCVIGLENSPGYHFLNGHLCENMMNDWFLIRPAICFQT